MAIGQLTKLAKYVQQIINVFTLNGTDFISYRPHGLGGVARPLTERLYNRLYVQDYGVTGIGFADEHEAWQKALDAAAGRDLVVPKGDYGKSLRNIIYADTHLILEPGAVIKRLGEVDSWMFINGVTGDPDYAQLYNGNGNIHITGGTFDMNGIPGVRTSAAGVFGHCKKVIIEHATFKNGFESHTLEINATLDTRILNCTFEDQITTGTGSYECVNVDSANAAGFPGFGSYDLTVNFNLLVDGCTFRNVFGGVSSHGIAVGAANHRAIQVVNCVFQDIKSKAIRAMGWNDSFIGGNKFFNIGEEAASIQFSHRNIVVGNTVMGASQRTSGSYSAFRIDGDDNVLGPNIVQDGGYTNKYPYAYGIAAGSKNKIDTRGATPGSSGLVSSGGTLTEIDGLTLLWTGDLNAPGVITLPDSLNNYSALEVTTGQVAGYTFETHVVRPYNYKAWGFPPSGGDKFVLHTIGVITGSDAASKVITGDITSLTTISILTDYQHVRQIFGRR